MPNSVKLRPTPANPTSHPQFLTEKEKAAQLHRLLLRLAKDESEKELKSVIRRTADFFRENIFGRTAAQIRAAIIECFKDYYDGEDYRSLEIDNISEITGIAENDLLPILEKMVKRGEVLEGKRRRYQEAGKHYNTIYKLAK